MCHGSIQRVKFKSESNLKELIKTDDYHFIHVIMNHPSDSGLESSCTWK